MHPPCQLHKKMLHSWPIHYPHPQLLPDTVFLLLSLKRISICMLSLLQVQVIYEQGIMGFSRRINTRQSLLLERLFLLSRPQRLSLLVSFVWSSTRYIALVDFLTAACGWQKRLRFL